jgi:hypothetical protein
MSWPGEDVKVVTEWNHNGRGMTLRSNLWFGCSKGMQWKAMTGDKIDGASIPRFLWRVVGSPYCGKYRIASIIHDVYCDNKTRPSPEVHRVFYEMMVASGLCKTKSWILWFAVRVFGPRFKGSKHAK